MPRFRLAYRGAPATIDGAGATRLFLRIDAPCRRGTATTGWACCSTIVPSQRWGIGQVVPAGWTASFKGGWSRGPGRSDHQVALLTRGDERVAVAVMSTEQPSHAYARRGCAACSRGSARYGTMTPVRALRAAAATRWRR